MSHEEDHCSQCQEQGHLAQNCPHMRCYECDKYGHIVVDCPHKIPPSGTPATHHKSSRSCHARSSSRHHCEDRDRQRTHTEQVHIPADHKTNHISRRTQGLKLKTHTWTITALINIPVTQERNLII